MNWERHGKSGCDVLPSISQYLPGGQCQSLSKPSPPEYEGGMLNSKPQCLGKIGNMVQLCRHTK